MRNQSSLSNIYMLYLEDTSGDPMRADKEGQVINLIAILQGNIIKALKYLYLIRCMNRVIYQVLPNRNGE